MMNRAFQAVITILTETETFHDAVGNLTAELANKLE